MSGWSPAPTPGQRWRHIEQGSDAAAERMDYVVRDRATLKGADMDDLPAAARASGGLVVYTRLRDGSTYVRSLSNFLARFVFEGAPRREGEA